MIRIIGSTNLKRCRPLLYNVSFGFTPRPCGKLILYFFLVLGPTSNGHLGLYPCNKKIKRRRRKLWSCFREYVEARGTNSTSVMHLSMIYKSKITSLVLLRVFLWACYHASKLTNTRINLGSNIQTSVGLVYRWMHGINNQRQWTVSTNRMWVSNYDTCQILIFGGYVKVGQLLCTRVITWISNILNILILGRFYLGTKILAWWYINPIDIVNKIIVKSLYPTSTKKMWIPYMRMAWKWTTLNQHWCKP